MNTDQHLFEIIFFSFLSIVWVSIILLNFFINKTYFLFLKLFNKNKITLTLSAKKLFVKNLMISILFFSILICILSILIYSFKNDQIRILESNLFNGNISSAEYENNLIVVNSYFKKYWIINLILSFSIFAFSFLIYLMQLTKKQKITIEEKLIAFENLPNQLITLVNKYKIMKREYVINEHFEKIKKFLTYIAYRFYFITSNQEDQESKLSKLQPYEKLDLIFDLTYHSVWFKIFSSKKKLTKLIIENFVDYSESVLNV